MELKVERRAIRPIHTVGRFYWGDELLFNTLEDKVRDYNKDGDLLDEGEEKVYAETAIPYGRYKVVVRFSPGMKRFLPLLIGVKHFEGILIHRGAHIGNSQGCILVGYNSEVGRLTGGETCEKILMGRFKDLAVKDETGKIKTYTHTDGTKAWMLSEEVWITITGPASA
jgi:hypothetical protein